MADLDQSRKVKEAKLLATFDAGVDRSMALWKAPLVALTPEDLDHYLYGFKELTERSQAIARDTELAWTCGPEEEPGVEARVLETLMPVARGMHGAVAAMVRGAPSIFTHFEAEL